MNKRVTKNDNNKKATKKAMIKAMEATLGIVTNACKSVGISRETHYRWLREDEEYKKQVDDIGDIALDFVETQLFKQIKDGEISSTIFYLKTKGKKRGYVEKSEVELSGETTTKTTIIWGGREIEV